MKIRRISGRSMGSTLPDGSLVIFRRSGKISVGSVVLAYQAGREVVKRISKIEDNKYYLLGDNLEESTDSREYGPVKRQDIRGKLLIAL